MTNYAIGHEAERQAAEYIKKQGYKILAINWKARKCEIDIVAEKNNRIHFIEVKYRDNYIHGKGFDYITDRKIKQMSYAAEVWIQENNWLNDYCLGAIELTGNDFLVSNFLPELV